MEMELSIAAATVKYNVSFRFADQVIHCGEITNERNKGKLVYIPASDSEQLTADQLLEIGTKMNNTIHAAIAALSPELAKLDVNAAFDLMHGEDFATDGDTKTDSNV